MNNEPDYDNLYFERKPMTQRIFDVDNAEDMALLWSILPDEAYRVKKAIMGCQVWMKYKKDAGYNLEYIKINWRDKKEITRPIQEATEADVGKLCMFWDYEDMPHYGVLREIDEESIYKDGVNLWKHCRRLTKQEIEELI